MPLRCVPPVSPRMVGTLVACLHAALMWDGPPYPAAAPVGYPPPPGCGSPAPPTPLGALVALPAGLLLLFLGGAVVAPAAAVAAGAAAASTVWARGGGWLPAAAAGGLAAASAAGVWAAGAPPVVVAALVATAMGGGGGGGWVAPPLAVAGLGVWLAAGGARRWDHAGAPWVAIWAAGSPAADGAGVGVAATATGGAVLVLRAVGLLGAVDTAADCPAAWMGLPGAALAGAGGGAPAALARALPTVLLLGTVAALGGVVQAALLGDEGRGEVGRGARHAGRRRNRAGYTPIA